MIFLGPEQIVVWGGVSFIAILCDCLCHPVYSVSQAWSCSRDDTKCILLFLDLMNNMFSCNFASQRYFSGLVAFCLKI
jgi:hypothetical protein